MRKFILILVLISNILTLIFGILLPDIEWVIVSLFSMTLIITILDHEAKIKYLNVELNRIRTSQRKKVSTDSVVSKYKGFEGDIHN